ncbi:hypothetical protein D8674_000285 [Pyrus ussuriensis x Pyrus communis]|uniref:Uncharacterized protein n=1 Tax=Pyrus ussuriensis x Pyrus communis TaxID=2448454 RepID=A0A5N5F306_9ROSA|nr:hypothetical protein D8674_000285 [Pyrus ussuriensis x Pyrus communis]
MKVETKLTLVREGMNSPDFFGLNGGSWSLELQQIQRFFTRLSVWGEERDVLVVLWQCGFTGAGELRWCGVGSVKNRAKGEC